MKIDTEEKVVIERKSVKLPTGNLEIEVFDGSLDFDYCMDIGARQNPKRGFLFVSKLLGKHIPVSPIKLRKTYHALADRLLPKLDDSDTLFIAMAETATGLGHGVYDACLQTSGALDSSKWTFCVSTRYKVNGAKRIAFTEDHSHATDQWIHLPTHLTDLSNVKTLVLIDDEISTGRTMLNLEQCLKSSLPALERVLWVTLTCLSDTTSRPCVSLLQGRFEFESTNPGVLPANAIGEDIDVSEKLSSEWGRIGISGLKDISDEAKHLIYDFADKVESAEKPVLFLGQAEFMHAAFKASEVLEELGFDCRVQSTTRSPIMVFGAIQEKMSAPDPMGTGVDHYVYNVNPSDYAHIFIMAETDSHDGSADFALDLGNATVLVP